MMNDSKKYENETRFFIDWDQKVISVPDVSKFFDMKMLYEAIHLHWTNYVVDTGEIFKAPLPIKWLSLHSYVMQPEFQLHLSLDAGRSGFTMFTDRIEIDKFDFMRPVDRYTMIYGGIVISLASKTIEVNVNRFDTMFDAYKVVQELWLSDKKRMAYPEATSLTPLAYLGGCEYKLSESWKLYLVKPGDDSIKPQIFQDGIVCDSFDFMKHIEIFSSSEWNGAMISWEEKWMEIDIDSYSRMSNAYGALRGIWVADVQHSTVDAPPTFPLTIMSAHHYRLGDSWKLQFTNMSGSMRHVVTGEFELDEISLASLAQRKPDTVDIHPQDANNRIRFLIRNHFARAPICVSNMLFWIEQSVYPERELSSKKDARNFEYNAMHRLVDGTIHTLVRNRSLDYISSVLVFAIRAVELATNDLAIIGDGDE